MNDEATRRILRGQAGAAVAGPRQMVELDEAEALLLLGSVSLGRVVFTRHALPAIRPVNHVLDGGDVVIRTHEGAALASQALQAGEPSGVVVAYEADTIDPVTHLGWSVVITGYARPVTDAGELARYEALLRPWVSGHMAHTVRIRPDLVNGIRLTAV